MTLTSLQILSLTVLIEWNIIQIKTKQLVPTLWFIDLHHPLKVAVNVIFVHSCTFRIYPEADHLNHLTP